MFRDRSDAGRQLAIRVWALGLDDPIVYALPRGGIPVAIEVATYLDAPLDLLIARKIGAPGFPEVALGAVVDGGDPQLILNEDVYRATGSDAVGLERARLSELAEIERRRIRYLGDRKPLDPADRVVVVVDDGVATGATAKVALAALRRQGASRIVLAVPVAPADGLEELFTEADDVVVVHASTEFWAIGPFYDDFHQLSDEETITLLDRAWSRGGGGAEPLG